MGNIAVARAGHPDAEPIVMLHGLGGTKASFLPTVAALADEYRVHSIDLPGFGDSVKPLRAGYDPRFFALAVCGYLDAAGIESAHLIGNSMGGRVAFEVGFRHADRVNRIVGLTPALAWLRGRGSTPLVKALRPELGLIQITPRPVIEQAVAGSCPEGATAGRRSASTSSSARTCSRAAAPRSTRRCETSTSTSPRATRGSGRGCASSRTSRCSYGARRTASCRSPSRGMSARRSRARSTWSSTAARAPARSAARDPRGDQALLARLTRFVRVTRRPSSSTIRARSFTRFGPTRTTFRNGRRRSRASRFFPRTKSTRRTSRVPPPITRTRTRLRPVGARATAGAGARERPPSGPSLPPPPAAASCRQRHQPAQRPDVRRPVGSERHRGVVVVVAQALAAEALVARPAVPSPARSGTRSRRSGRPSSCTCRRSRCGPRASAPPRVRARPSARPSGSCRPRRGRRARGRVTWTCRPASRSGRHSRSCSRPRASGRCRSATGRSRSRRARTRAAADALADAAPIHEHVHRVGVVGDRDKAIAHQRRRRAGARARLPRLLDAGVLIRDAPHRRRHHRLPR